MGDVGKMGREEKMEEAECVVLVDSDYGGLQKLRGQFSLCRWRDAVFCESSNLHSSASRVKRRRRRDEGSSKSKDDDLFEPRSLLSDLVRATESCCSEISHSMLI
jgi:hypothetical protein